MKTNMLKSCIIAIALTLSTFAFAGKPDKALYEGITKGNIEVIKQAITDGADVNKKYSMKLPLLWALETSHHVSIIQLLIDKGADVNATSITGSILTEYGQRVETPAIKAQWTMDFYKKYKVDTVVDPAIYSSISEVVNVLLNAGANPNYDMGTILGTPIMGSIAFGISSEEARAEFIKAMISHPTNHANANDRMRTTESVKSSSEAFKMVDKEKHPTPLMYAIQKGYTKIAIALIEGGADVNITMNVYKSKSDMWAVYNTKTTVTALDIAKSKKNLEVETLLLAKGAQ